MRGHNIKFNEDLDIFIDWSFVLEFIKYSNGFVRISRFLSILKEKFMIRLKTDVVNSRFQYYF